MVLAPLVVDMTSHQRNVRQAMEANIGAWFHPTAEQVAFLYPSGEINIYNSRTFEQEGQDRIKTFNGSHNELSNSEKIQRADMSLSAKGFDRAGRSQKAKF